MKYRDRAFGICIIFFVQLSNAFTVMLDPGHGGQFKGCVSATGKLEEKDITLDIAQRIARYLKQKYIEVAFTRTNNQELDVDLLTDLKKRVDKATQAQADIFVSIHANYNPNPGTRGYELFIPYKIDYPAESYTLASRIHHRMVHHLETFWQGTLGNMNTYDRGIRQARFNVLSVSCPAVLIELDYLTNTAVEQKFLDPEFRDTFAKIITDGILDYVRNKK